LVIAGGLRLIAHWSSIISIGVVASPHVFGGETINKSNYRGEWNGIPADFNCVVNFLSNVITGSFSSRAHDARTASPKSRTGFGHRASTAGILKPLLTVMPGVSISAFIIPAISRESTGKKNGTARNAVDKR